ncbi:Pentatricopeptide repeat-containing protein [Hordeum vulgare]|nr:Pentatricopeptide repeat-containing protein [Hordeum vulgare]
MIGDVCLYIVGKDEYDELALSEVIFAITSAVKDVCAKPPTERLFLDKYGRICLCLDEIVWQAVSELGAGAKSLLLSLEPRSSSDASGEYFFSDYGLGILEPIKAGIRDAKLGVGKQEQDDFFTASANFCIIF